MKLFEIKVQPYEYQVKEIKDEFEHTINATFKTMDGSKIEVSLDALVGDELAINFNRNGQFELTGQGDQYKILFTVKDIIEKYLPKISHSVNGIMFTADENEHSRVKLYAKRVVPLITQLLDSDWTGPNISRTNFQIIFTWSRTSDVGEFYEGIGVKNNKLSFDYNDDAGQSTKFGKKKLEPYVTRSAMVNHNTIFSVYVKNDPQFVNIVKALKKKNDIHVDPDDYQHFLRRTTLYIARLLKSQHTDVVITPKSSHEFLDDLLSSLKERMPHLITYPSLYTKQIDVSKIKINYDDPRLTDKISHSLESILKKAQSTGNFEIKKILPQHRKFITGIFSEPEKKTMDKLTGQSICVLDDVFSTGHTVTNIITNISQYEPENVFGLCIFKTK